MENNTAEAVPSGQQPANLGDEIKNFYTGEFRQLALIFLRDPINGLFALFQRPPAKASTYALILYSSVFALYLLGAYLLAGDMARYMSFLNFLSIALLPVFVMLAVTCLSFFIKAAVGQAQFRDELLTGALCGFPLGALIPLALLARLFGSGADLLTVFRNPMGAGMLMSLIAVYLLWSMANVVQQSLKAGGLRESNAWYLAPLVVVVSFGIATSVVSNLF